MRVAVALWGASRRQYQAPGLVGRRWWSTTTPRGTDGVPDRTRNIGIIAHIDAGKTTTTERMLYYSGYTRRIGDVDEGSTVTDFLPAERARGITIQSAAITFHWPPKGHTQGSKEASNSDSYNVNLIDTPGHADFTFEVLRSLRVLDGAVCILDGVAGVEAQTEKVWTQASHYRIPRIVYVNKLDREGAAFGRTVKEIGSRLHGWPAVCQIPWWSDGHARLAGVGDVVNLRGMWWSEGGDGKDIVSFGLAELREKSKDFAEELCRARVALVEMLSEHDDQMVEEFLENNEDHIAIPASAIMAALRRCVLQPNQEVFPVFVGASFRNVGVQPLLDAVAALLPSPSERPSPELGMGQEKGTLSALLDGSLMARLGIQTPSKSSKAVMFSPSDIQACALAFKVVHDPRRGVLVYVRVYSGSISRGSIIFNTNLGVVERPTRLYHMYASDAVDVPSIDAGQIGVIPGLRYTRTGDTLLIYRGAMNARTPPPPIDSMQLRPIDVPPPVFFLSVEPESLSAEKHLNECLDLLLREDPSLSISHDPESGQTQLAGMGELHLEIAQDRLLSDFKARASMGQIEIGYREAIQEQSDTLTHVFDREIGGKRARASCEAAVCPRKGDEPLDKTDSGTATVFELPDNNMLIISHVGTNTQRKATTEAGTQLPTHLTLQDVLSSLRNGVTAALCRGPKHHFPMHSTSVTLTLDPASQLFPDSSPTGISSAARLATKSALKNAADKRPGSALMEPVMLVTISVSEEHMGAVTHDLNSARGGTVLSLDAAAGVVESGDESSSTEFTATVEDDVPVIDPRRIYAPRDPFEGSHSSGTRDDIAGTRQRQILARVPLREMVGYLKYLRSLTGGRGTFTMKVDKFEKVSAQRMKSVLQGMSGGVL